MSCPVPIFNAAQDVARALFPAYGQSWTPPDADDPVAGEAARAKQREQEQMFRDGYNRLFDGIRSGAIRLSMKGPSGDWIEADYDIVQYANSHIQVACREIVSGAYSHSSIRPYDGYRLFVERANLDNFIQSIGGAITTNRPTGIRTNHQNSAEGQCEVFLRQRAKDNQPFRNKDDAIKTMLRSIPNLTKRGAQRVWDRAAAPEWKRPGRKSAAAGKSTH